MQICSVTDNIYACETILYLCSQDQWRFVSENPIGFYRLLRKLCENCLRPWNLAKVALERSILLHMCGTASVIASFAVLELNAPP